MLRPCATSSRRRVRLVFAPITERHRYQSPSRVGPTWCQPNDVEAVEGVAEVVGQWAAAVRVRPEVSHLGGWVSFPPAAGCYPRKVTTKQPRFGPTDARTWGSLAGRPFRALTAAVRAAFRQSSPVGGAFAGVTLLLTGVGIFRHGRSCGNARRWCMAAGVFIASSAVHQRAVGRCRPASVPRPVPAGLAAV
jgi:hypothetical protein